MILTYVSDIMERYFAVPGGTDLDASVLDNMEQSLQFLCFTQSPQTLKAVTKCWSSL
jgi:hypothetical protein